MVKRKTKGLLAMLMALAMIVTLLPAQAFAYDILSQSETSETLADGTTVKYDVTYLTDGPYLVGGGASAVNGNVTIDLSGKTAQSGEYTLEVGERVEILASGSYTDFDMFSFESNTVQVDSYADIAGDGIVFDAIEASFDQYEQEIPFTVEAEDGKAYLSADYIGNGTLRLYKSGFAGGFSTPELTINVVAPTYVAEIGEAKYTKLSDAILALEDGDTLTLLGDYDFVANEGYEYYWIDDGGNKPYNKNNQLEIAANNVTIDLNGYSITNLMNNSLCVGANASGTTYQNITIKDGSLEVGIDDYARKDNKLYAYVVSVRHAEGVKFENLTTLGGINVTDASVVELNGLTFEGTKFYAVCSQSGATVTLKDGDFSKYEKGSANTLFWVETGSSMSIYGGTYNLSGTTKFENEADPVLYGGIYNFNPAAYVADGYKAVVIDDDPLTYQVGVIEATATQEGDVFDNEVTFNMGTFVKDTGSDEEITGSAEVAQSIVLTGTFDYDYDEVVTDDASKAAVGAANLAQFDEAQLSDIVAAAYTEAGAQAADIEEVKIVIVSDGVTEGTTTGGLPTLTYEVHPEAITYDGSGDAINSVAIANSQLGEGASFTIKLPVSDEMYAQAGSGRRYVSVKHVSSEDGYDDEVGNYEIKGSAGDYYIICNVTHFSEFELEPVTLTNIAGAKVSSSITLQDDIKINFYVSDLDDYDLYYTVRYTYNGVTTEVNLGDVYADANGAYKFVVAECAARQMNDTVDFAVFYKGTEIFRTPNYSIRMYCEKQLAKSGISAKLRNICLAVLDYGAAAQTYFGYQTSNLANSNYTAGTVATTTVPNFAIEANWDGAVSKVTASLSLKSRTELNFYIYSASGIYDEVTVSVGGSSWTNYTFEYVGDQSGLRVYMLTVKGLASGLLGQNVSIEVQDGGYWTVASATYSPMAYAYRNQNKGNGLGNVCKALYNYYVAASAYFN